jgi:putative DNA primase/helicase
VKRIPDNSQARDIAIALGGRKIGDGSYLCHCPGPSHRRGDLNPSLSIRDGDNGRLLLHCFSGDSYDDIVAALRAKGLRP